MRKIWKFLLLPAAVALVLLLRQPRLPGWETPEGMSSAQRSAVQREILRTSELPWDEEALLAAGIPVMDTEEGYPEYLANSDGLRAFAEGKTGRFGFFRIREDGVRYVAFLREGEETFLFAADMGREDLLVEETAFQPVYDMELTDWDVFYYRLYPAGDPHYIDYTQLRLTPPDREKYDLARKYIIPVGYQMVNLFLVDWQEGDWGELSFHDTLEVLYQMKNGEALPWEDFPKGDQTHCRMVPARIFEETLLPYFDISREKLREACGCREDAYPWRFVHGDDLTAWRYPMCEPEVTEVRDNGDGTLTLMVQVYSPELKTDRLFCHELTVRPLEGGRFQYVGNRVTHVSERGLPPKMARFALD